MTTQQLLDRPHITICIGGCDVIVDTRKYNINGVLCPDCQKERDEVFEKAQRRPRMSEKDRVLRSYDDGRI